MCPVCMASAILMASGVMTTGGLAALFIKLSRSEPSEKEITSSNPTKKEN